MMKKPDVIKKAMSGCHSFGSCSKCPYFSFSATLGCKRQRNSDALAYIQQLEAQVPKWISVVERLPEDERSVLTVNGHGEIRIMGLWSKRGDEWTWLHNGRMMHYNDITHWMPLPEPPKEEDK